MSVCLSVRRWTFKSLDLQSSYLHIRCISTQYGSSSYMKVIGQAQGDRSKRGPQQVFMRLWFYICTVWAVFFVFCFFPFLCFFCVIFPYLGTIYTINNACICPLLRTLNFPSPITRLLYHHSGEVCVQHIFTYGQSNGVTAIFLTWPEVTTGS